MKHPIKFIVLFVYGICHISSSYAFNNRATVDTSIRFYSLVDKAQFDTLSGIDFTWAIFKPINDTISFIRFSDRNSFVQKLLTGQKALFYIWELEGAVQQGGLGFSNFYYNYKDNFSETIKGLRFLNDTAMLNVLYGANRIYLLHNKKIMDDYRGGDWKYTQKQFSSYDSAYIDKHEHTMKLLESYIRQHADEFVKFK